MPKKLTMGSKGPEVEELQRQLINLGYGSLLKFGVNGSFDSYTESALRKYKRDRGILEVGSSPLTSKTGGAEARASVGDLKVGQTYQFTGGPVYKSSDATSPAANRGASKVKVTIINTKYGPHSVHSISQDCSYGSPNYVYGWTDPGNYTVDKPTTAGPETWEKMREDQKVDIPKVDIPIVPVTDMNMQGDPSSLFIMNLVTGKRIDIPATPQEISDNVSVNYESETPRGRSIAYTGYTSTENKNVSFTVRLFGELIKHPTTGDKKNRLPELINKLKALEYPKYVSGVVIPPNCYVNMYRGIRFSALCTSVDVVWGGPIKKDAYTYADVTLQFRNVRDVPYQVVEVEGGGNNG